MVTLPDGTSITKTDLHQKIQEVNSKISALEQQIASQTISDGSSTDADREVYLEQQKNVLSQTITKIYEENQAMVRQNKEMQIPRVARFEDYEFYSANIAKLRQPDRQIVAHIAAKKQYLFIKNEKLKRVYKHKWQKWKKHVETVEKTRIKKDPSIEELGITAVVPLITNRGDANPKEYFTSSRQNRRNNQKSSFVIRTEADMEETLRMIQEMEDNDPEVRARKSAAIIPDMILDEEERNNVYIDENRIINDPVNCFLHQQDTDSGWTVEEKAIFLKKYGSYPKQFGKIAQFLPSKTPEQCVRYYYMNKKSMNLKSMLYRRDGKRRKAPTISAITQTTEISSAERKEENRRKKSSKQYSSEEEVEEMEEVKSDFNVTAEKIYEEEDLNVELSCGQERQRSVSVGGSYNGNQMTTAKWSVSDRAAALRAYQKHGRDFHAVAREVGTKTEDQCRNFYHNFKRKHGVTAMKGLAIFEASLENILTEPCDDQDMQFEGIEDAEEMPESLNLSERRMRRRGGLTRKQRESHIEYYAEQPYDDDVEEVDQSVGISLVDELAEKLMERILNDSEKQAEAEKSLTEYNDKGSEPAEPEKAPRRRPNFSSYWSKSEKSSFISGLAKYGKDFVQIASLLSTKTPIQVRNYFQNNLEKLQLDQYIPEGSKDDTGGEKNAAAITNLLNNEEDNKNHDWYGEAKTDINLPSVNSTILLDAESSINSLT